MDMTEFLPQLNEKPLEHLPVDGGYTSIFRTIACIGDSLSSGEFEGRDQAGTPSYHDMYEYSWGQFIARAAGVKVYNFSRGGMSAKWYMDSFAQEKGFWSEEFLAQAYIMALGVNDLKPNNVDTYLGSEKDIDLTDYTKNADTFAGHYGAIIQRYRAMQPHGRFFLMTRVKCADEATNAVSRAHRDLLYKLADMFEDTYVIDLYEYAPVYDEEFKKNFYLGGHLSPAGYKLTARMVMAYIDYIVRHNLPDFKQIGFIGTPHSYYGVKL